VGDDALLSTAVPPLLLQPLVENSLKYGVDPQGAPLHLTLTARRADGAIELEFADDGRLHGNGSPGLGVGLENLEQRVRRFAGADASVESGSRDGGGFVVRMRWPQGEGGTR
jgi:LytS/YehU family sensor histidine kinase